MSSKNRQGLSPVASLCLRVVRGWLGVVSRGKGGELRNGVPYTRLKATEVQQQLEAEQGVAVSSKTVQRALTQLVVGGHLSRRQLYKHRYNRTYWYAPGELEQQLQKHRPSVVSQQQKATVKNVSTNDPTSSFRRDIGVPSDLNAQITPNSTLLESKPKSAEEQNRKEEVVIRAWSPKKPVQIPPAAPQQWHKAQQQLAAVVQRATGFRGPSSGAAIPRTAKPVERLAESPKISGFLR